MQSSKFKLTSIDETVFKLREFNIGQLKGTLSFSETITAVCTVQCRGIWREKVM